MPLKCAAVSATEVEQGFGPSCPVEAEVETIVDRSTNFMEANSMRKTVFHFFLFGMTVLAAASSSHAASFEYMYGQFRPTAPPRLRRSAPPSRR